MFDPQMILPLHYKIPWKDPGNIFSLIFQYMQKHVDFSDGNIISLLWYFFKVLSSLHHYLCSISKNWCREGNYKWKKNMMIMKKKLFSLETVAHTHNLLCIMKLKFSIGFMSNMQITRIENSSFKIHRL